MGIDTVQICYDDGVNGESCFSPVSLSWGGIKEGLISWWSMNETSGTRADSHGSNDLTPINTPGYESGKVSNALDLTTVNSEYLECVSPTGTVGTSSDFTFGAWLKRDGAGGDEAILSLTNNYGENNADIDFCIWYDDDMWYAAITATPTSGITEAYWIDNTVSPRIDSEAKDGVWEFCVFVYDSADAQAGNPALELFVNNESRGKVSCETDPQNNHDRISFGRFRSWSYGNGSIDEAFYYNRKLTTDEISTLYNSGSGVSYADL